MAVMTWGDPNASYYVQIISNAGTVTVSPFVVGSAGTGGSNPFNPHGDIVAWSGGLVAAWDSDDATVIQFRRLTNTGGISGSVITLAPGTGSPDANATPTYSWSNTSMAVDSSGDVIFGLNASDVYTSEKYLEYNSSNVLVASGTLAGKSLAGAFAALPGGGFVTVDYAPTGAWSSGYPGFNLEIHTKSQSKSLPRKGLPSLPPNRRPSPRPSSS
jgi:hypothetical protein